jgi:hypothetical protein
MANSALIFGRGLVKHQLMFDATLETSVGERFHNDGDFPLY